MKRLTCHGINLGMGCEGMLQLSAKVLPGERLEEPTASGTEMTIAGGVHARATDIARLNHSHITRTGAVGRGHASMLASPTPL